MVRLMYRQSNSPLELLMPTRVILSQTGPVARIRFEASNEIHILSAETRQSLTEILAKLKDDDACRVIVFEAQGRTFLAGADLAELQVLHQDSALWYAEAGQSLMNEVAGLRAVTICAIQAACVGGGCELALACDFRFAAAGARIGLPETSLGLIPGWGGTVRSTLLLGPAIARRIILTAELLSAENAQRLGLVDQVFPDADLQQGVEQLIEQLLTRGPQAIKRVKRLISRISQSGFKKSLEREARQFAACYASGEPAIGIAAFREKKVPAWGETKVADDTPSRPAELDNVDTDENMPDSHDETKVTPPSANKRPRRNKPKPD